jgi:hypothetical protein
VNRTFLAGVLLGLLAACSDPSLSEIGSVGAAEPAGPADPAAEMRPDLIVVDPQKAEPGDIVALQFPQETTRGILFALEQRVGETWALRYFLTSDGPGPGWRLNWQLAGEQGAAVEDIGVGGFGPDHVPIPEVVDPGDYRICTANAGDEFCAPFEIIES